MKTAASVSAALAVSCLMAAGTPSAASDLDFERLAFEPAGEIETRALGEILGGDFVTGEGAFPAGIEVARAALRSDGRSDFIAVQRGWCSNRACDYEFMAEGEDGVVRHVQSLESWADPLISSSAAPGWHRDLVVFEHVTADCSACSPPFPVLYSWSGGSYDRMGLVPEALARVEAVLNPYP